MTRVAGTVKPIGREEKPSSENTQAKCFQNTHIHIYTDNYKCYSLTGYYTLSTLAVRIPFAYSATPIVRVGGLVKALRGVGKSGPGLYPLSSGRVGACSSRLHAGP